MTIPSSVTSIDKYAFYSCNGLSSVTVPYSVGPIGDYAFYNCSGLTEVPISGSVTSIGSYAFAECNGLTSVAIPSSVFTIGECAFISCSGLLSVTIPSSVTSIGSQAFCNCSSLKAIMVDADNTHYDSRNNCNAIIQTERNELIQGCKNTVIPNTVTAIGNSAFRGCSSLTSVIIPNSVISIGNWAFENCSGLTSVTIGNSVVSIGTDAFHGCSGLTSVTIPNSVTTIGSFAFYGCSSLTSVTIPNSVTSMGGYVFWRCNSLASIYCMPMTPPILNGSGAIGDTTSVGIIYVPCESVNAYRNAPYWSDYHRRMKGTRYLDYTITFVSNSETMGTVGVGTVDCNNNITVTATAKRGYRFTGWSDGGTGNPRTFHLTGDTSVAAIFDYASFAMTGQPSDDARGSLSGGDTVYSGEEVTIIDTSHVAHSNDNPRTVKDTTDNNYVYTNNHTVSVLSENEQQGTVGGGGTTAHLGTSTIYAIPATGYHFRPLERRQHQRQPYHHCRR